MPNEKDRYFGYGGQWRTPQPPNHGTAVQEGLDPVIDPLDDIYSGMTKRTARDDGYHTSARATTSEQD